MIVKVKVCGITCYDDAVMALDQDVDALGFNFYRPSPRYIDPAEARSIIRRLPPLVMTVGVFVNVEKPADAEEAARLAGVQVLQLHGDETAEYCRQLAGWVLIKALRMCGESLQETPVSYPVQAFLLDSKDERLLGGTGKTFDWSLSQAIKSIRPIILAGGLHSANVAEAIRIVQPYGIDVCSGIENSSGRKDIRRLKEFMHEVRNVRNEIRRDSPDGAR